LKSYIQPSSLKAVNPSRLSDQISQQLLEKIVSKEYLAGTLLPSERELSEMTHASRIAVREGIGSLVAKGIVSVRHGRGTTVNPIEEWNTLDPQVLMLLHGRGAIIQLMEFRRIIEPEMAALAAERITPEEIEQLTSLSELPDDDTVEEHARRDIRFHLFITKVTRNNVMLMVMTSLSELTYENRRQAFVIDGELAKARQWHKRIMEAIVEGDPISARHSMRDHIQQAGDALKNQDTQQQEN
jgi:GntR family transcriptional regulator, transcriptional repressor for pyruvate dehydrogenase complex